MFPSKQYSVSAVPKLSFSHTESSLLTEVAYDEAHDFHVLQNRGAGIFSIPLTAAHV